MGRQTSPDGADPTEDFAVAPVRDFSPDPAGGSGPARAAPAPIVSR